MKIVSRIYRNIARHTANFAASNLELAMQLRARDSSSEYAESCMFRAVRHSSPDSLLESAVSNTEDISGCICEFGVFQGRTLRLIADAAPECVVYGFDSFSGLPADWRPGFNQGTFKTAAPVFKQPNVRLRVGLFEQTVPEFLRETHERIRLAHIDCDLYSSAICVLKHIIPRLAEGGILVFDEYFNYPGWQAHEHRALLEAAQDFDLDVEYVSFNTRGEQVSAILRSRQLKG